MPPGCPLVKGLCSWWAYEFRLLGEAVWVESYNTDEHEQWTVEFNLSKEQAWNSPEEASGSGHQLSDDALWGGDTKASHCGMSQMSPAFHANQQQLEVVQHLSIVHSTLGDMVHSGYDVLIYQVSSLWKSMWTFHEHPGLVSSAVRKYHDQKAMWRWKGLFGSHILVIDYHRRKSRQELK